MSRRENAPDFVKCELGIHVADFIAYLKSHEKQSGWVNIHIKESKGGKLYADLNDYDPNKKDGSAETTVEYPQDEINPADVPF